MTTISLATAPQILCRDDGARRALDAWACGRRSTMVRGQTAAQVWMLGKRLVARKRARRGATHSIGCGGLWPFQPRSATSLARGRMGALLLYSATIGLLGGRPLHLPLPPSNAAPRLLPTTTTSTSDALELHSRLAAAAEEDTPLGRAVGHGLQVLKDAFRLYGADRVVSSFNGGKDAVAILHLCRAALAAHDETARLRVIFFEVDDEFPEIDAFVRESVKKHDLDLVAMSGVGFAEGLGQCIAMHDSKAFVLGTREADPNAGGQQDFAPSSDWMPPFMRVNPILTWGYHDVWDFLRTFDLDYCALYDDGYTSLGKQASTNRNPALKRPDGTYAPAWLLKDESLERAGRIATKKPSSAAAAILSKSGTNDSDGAATADEEDERSLRGGQAPCGERGAAHCWRRDLGRQAAGSQHVRRRKVVAEEPACL